MGGARLRPGPAQHAAAHPALILLLRPGQRPVGHGSGGAAAQDPGVRHMSRSVLHVDRSRGWGDLLVRPSARWLGRAAIVSALLLVAASAASPQTLAATGESIVTTLVRWTPLIARGFAL